MPKRSWMVGGIAVLAALVLGLIVASVTVVAALF
jgi:hypothetical protein